MLCLGRSILGRRRAQWRRHTLPFMAEQRALLVNLKLRWVKDRLLDSVVARERHLRPALHLVHLISSNPRGCATPYDLAARRRHFGVPTANIASFLRRFPTVFLELSRNGNGAPLFSLSEEVLCLREQELETLADSETDLTDRLRRLLMLTTGRSLPLHTIDQLQWDMGLPSDYHLSFVPRHPEAFDLVRPPGDERVWLKLVSWDPCLAISELQKNASSSATDTKDCCLAFPVNFTRGFGLKKKCMAWLREWQTLPYTSPYADASGLDPRTDVAEKRMVGVFHELLHLTIAKKTERRNVSNLRMQLGLPQKFTKVFERHPGIFYLSEKLATQTVVLKEAYDGRELLNKHPLQEIREKYMTLLRASQPQRNKASSVEKDSEIEGQTALNSDSECSKCYDDLDAFTGEFSDVDCSYSRSVSDEDHGGSMHVS